MNFSTFTFLSQNVFLSTEPTQIVIIIKCHPSKNRLYSENQNSFVCVHLTLKTSRTFSTRGNLCKTTVFVGWLWLSDKPHALFQRQQQPLLHPASESCEHFCSSARGLLHRSSLPGQRLEIDGFIATFWMKSLTQYVWIKWWHIKWKRSWSINPPITDPPHSMDFTVEEKQLERLNVWPKY